MMGDVRDKNYESDVERWKEEGVIFLKEIGVRVDDFLLDFGCGEGHFTIPAARLVGNKGRVYAVDNDEEALEKLRQIIEKENLKNISILKGILNIKERSVDVALAYDIIHLVFSRQSLYKSIKRVLKPGGLLSVYPKHCKFDDPGWGLKNVDLKNITDEIEREGFYFERKFFKKILHDTHINDGCILNFKKN